jgi:hypothetical protein
MQFAENPRDGDPLHASAIRRLGEARDEQSRLADRLAVAEGTPAERAAAQDLAAGRAGLAAREAMLIWIERGL